MGTGKDVWEIVAAVRDNDGDAAETARYLEIPLGLVQAAISYYGAYREEMSSRQPKPTRPGPLGRTPSGREAAPG